MILFVGNRARQLWQDESWANLPIHYGGLVAAGLVYLIGWLPSVWFWRKMMASLGAHVGFADAARAYYCGHLGKYVPGKAIVLVIRAALLKDRGVRPSIAALTATYETLLMMGAGLAVAIAMIPWMGIPTALPALQKIVDPNQSGAAFVFPITVVVGCLLAIPIISWLLSRISRIMIPAEMKEQGSAGSVSTGSISMGQIAQGLAAFVVGWALLGLSLGLTIHSLGSEPIAWENWPLWTGAAAAATVLGFVMVFVPGGIGVREGVLMELLQSQSSIGQSQAVAAAIILRMVWLVAEIGISVGLYYGVGRTNCDTEEKSDVDESASAMSDTKEESL